MSEKSRMEVWVERMQALHKYSDTEMAHAEADRILCEVLNYLSCEKLVEEWHKVPKWYA